MKFLCIFKCWYEYWIEQVMRNCILRSVIFIFTISISVVTFAGNGDNDSAEHPFAIGEKLEFKVKYGWFTIGKASVTIPQEVVHNEIPSYKVNVVGETAGMLNFFSNTTDVFDATISKYELKPFVASQNFQEGRKRDIQTNYFDYETGKVKVQKVNHKENKPQEPKYYDLEPDAFDMLSSYLYLRSIDFSSLNLQDSVMIKVFFGKKHYDFGLEYGGTESIKSRIGKVKAHKFYILFPVSSTFPEEKSVIVWTTMDENQLPLRVQAQLKFGKVTCDLVDFDNLKFDRSY